MDFHPAGLIGLSWYTYRFHKFHKNRTKMPYLRGSMSKNNFGTQAYSKYRNKTEYRLAKIERAVRNQTPELKQYQKFSTLTSAGGAWDVIDITSDISAGDAEYERTGAEIKIYGVSINWIATTEILVPMLVLSPNGIYPTGANFTGVAFSQVLRTDNEDHKILKYLHRFEQGLQMGKYTRRFKRPLVVKYGSSSGPVERQNRLSIVVHNPGATQKLLDYNITVYFTDA